MVQHIDVLFVRFLILAGVSVRQVFVEKFHALQSLGSWSCKMTVLRTCSPVCCSIYHSLMALIRKIGIPSPYKATTVSLEDRAYTFNDALAIQLFLNQYHLVSFRTFQY